MGSGKSKDHESFTVAPADDDAPSTQPATAIEPVTASDQQLFDHYPSDDAIGPITGATSSSQSSSPGEGGYQNLPA